MEKDISHWKRTEDCGVSQTKSIKFEFSLDFVVFQLSTNRIVTPTTNFCQTNCAKLIFANFFICNFLCSSFETCAWAGPVPVRVHVNKVKRNETRKKKKRNDESKSIRNTVVCIERKQSICSEHSVVAARKVKELQKGGKFNLQVNSSDFRCLPRLYVMSNHFERIVWKIPLSNPNHDHLFFRGSVFFVRRSARVALFKRSYFFLLSFPFRRCLFEAKFLRCALGR